MDQVFKDLKVAEFGWAVAVPSLAKYLGDFGAEVVKVESNQHLDLSRVTEPYKDGIVGLDTSVYFAQFNTSKYGVALNLAHPKGIEVAKRLVGWADVVLEGFRPGAMKKLGLGYEDLRAVRPDIIMASCSQFGNLRQTPRYESYRGYGHSAGAASGHFHLTGYSDREPAQAGIPFSDVAYPVVALCAIVAALDYRRRTGRGQYLDISHLEITVPSILPALLDRLVNRRVQVRVGNRSSYAAPHGAFRCYGDDSWCTIAVSTEKQWERFCQAIGRPAWTAEARFASLSLRKEHEDELEDLVEEWTVNYSPEVVMQAMQRAGVPAGVVRTARELVDDDPHLRERAVWIGLHHPAIGLCHHRIPPVRLSETPARLRTSPCLGQHNEYVCTRLLGMSDREFAELLTAGVFE